MKWDNTGLREIQGWGGGPGQAHAHNLLHTVRDSKLKQSNLIRSLTSTGVQKAGWGLESLYKEEKVVWGNAEKPQGK